VSPMQSTSYWLNAGPDIIYRMADGPITVQIQRLPGNEDVPLPEYQSEHAAGMDVHAAVPHQTIIKPGQITLVPCGFAIAVPLGYEAQIRPRSGLAMKHGISLPNTPGTIDADYRGQVCVALINHSSASFTVKRCMRVAQLIIKPVPRIQWQLTDQLPSTSRGDGGFGHTGQ
ncbi:MAG: dUTP diphosphatase, partial [Pirellulaceae bacterium]|nr:dUTP diphosphatase [Pirellulaceae bacterium]